MPDQTRDDNKKVVTDPFAGNSYKERNDRREQANQSTDISYPEERQKLEPIAKAKKQSLAVRFYNLFIPYSPKVMVKLWLNEVIKPTVVNTLVEFSHNTLDIWLTGEVGGVAGRRASIGRGDERGRNERTPYNSISDERRSRVRNMTKSRTSMERLYVGSTDEARNVLMRIEERIRDYNSACVADIYDLVGIPSDWPEQKIGWDDANYFRDNSGYRRTGRDVEIIVPDPVSLK